MTERSATTMPVPVPPADFERLERLLGEQEWIFAKTMPQNPHHYTLRKKWARDEDFVWVVEIIRRHGYKTKFGRSWYTQLDVNDHFYWTMGARINNPDGSPCTILINRKSLGAVSPLP
jgi:hypothetical protein